MEAYNTAVRGGVCMICDGGGYIWSNDKSWGRVYEDLYLFNRESRGNWTDNIRVFILGGGIQSLYTSQMDQRLDIAHNSPIPVNPGLAGTTLGGKMCIVLVECFYLGGRCMKGHIHFHACYGTWVRQVAMTSRQLKDILMKSLRGRILDMGK